MVRRLFLRIWWVTRTVILMLVATTTPVIAIGVALALWVLVLLPGAIPQPRPLAQATPTTVLAANGEMLGTIEGFDLSLPMTKNDLNTDMVNAVIASEDRRFFSHSGIDPWGILRAVRANTEGDRQGASTITQQLVKLRYLDSDPSIDRKFREAIVAQQLERSMSKEDILFEYLSSAYFGSGATGVRAAALRYFRTDPADLSLSQAAYLAGVLPSPSSRSAHTDLAAAEAARVRTLQSMVDAGLLEPDRRAELLNFPLWLVDDFGNPFPGHPETYTAVYPLPKQTIYSFYPEIVSMVEEYLLANYGPQGTSQGFTVTTTIDLPLQAFAQQAVDDAIKGAPNPSVASALVAVDPETGFVKALADTNDFAISQVNLATGGDTGFQIGSTAKAFVVASALESGQFTPTSALTAPGSYTTASGDVVRNFGGSAGGSVTLRSATEQSWNTTFVALAERLGPDAVADTARRLGVVSWTPDRSYGPSVALGAYETSPLEMASAFATLANDGKYLSPVFIQRIVDQDDKVIEDNTVRSGTQAVSPAVAHNVTDILRGVVDRGTGTRAKVANRPVAGKTGTAENFTAAWFVGYTPQLATAVWLGHSDGVRPLPAFGGFGEQVGGSIPAKTFATFTSQALQGLPTFPFPPPEPIQVGPPLRPSPQNTVPSPPQNPTVSGVGPRQATLSTPAG